MQRALVTCSSRTPVLYTVFKFLKASSWPHFCCHVLVSKRQKQGRNNICVLAFLFAKITSEKNGKFREHFHENTQKMTFPQVFFLQKRQKFFISRKSKQQDVFALIIKTFSFQPQTRCIDHQVRPYEYGGEVISQIYPRFFYGVPP